MLCVMRCEGQVGRLNLSPPNMAHLLVDSGVVRSVQTYSTLKDECSSSFRGCRIGTEFSEGQELYKLHECRSRLACRI